MPTSGKAAGRLLDARPDDGGDRDAGRVVAAEQGDRDAGEPECGRERVAVLVELGQQRPHAGQAGDGAAQDDGLHDHGVRVDAARQGGPGVGARGPQVEAEAGAVDDEVEDDAR